MDDTSNPQTQSGKYGSIEIRAIDNSLDEIVGEGFVHLERMSDGCWWLGLTDRDGHSVHCNLWGTGKRIEEDGEVEHEVVAIAEYEGIFTTEARTNMTEPIPTCPHCKRAGEKYLAAMARRDREFAIRCELESRIDGVVKQMKAMMEAPDWWFTDEVMQAWIGQLTNTNPA